MKIEVNVSKKYFFTILIAILALGGLIFVYAVSPNPDIPNPGHAISELQKCPAGSVLKSNSSGDWECLSDVGGGSISCVDSTRLISTTTNNPVQVSCPTGHLPIACSTDVINWYDLRTFGSSQTAGCSMLCSDGRCYGANPPKRLTATCCTFS